MLGVRPTPFKRFSPLLFSAVSFFLFIFLASLPSSWSEKRGAKKKRSTTFSRLIRVLSPFLDFHRIHPGRSFTLTLDRQGTSPVSPRDPAKGPRQTGASHLPATKHHAFFKKRDTLLARLEAQAPF